MVTSFEDCEGDQWFMADDGTYYCPLVELHGFEWFELDMLFGPLRLMEE